MQTKIANTIRRGSIPASPLSLKWILLFLLLITTAYTETGDAISYSADYVLYNKADTIIVLNGNSIICYDDVVLTADTIFYHTSKRIMIATGNPVMIDDTDTLYGDYIAYNIREQSGKVRHGRYDSEDELHYTGERIARDSGAVFIDNGSYTTSQAVDSVHYFFYGKKIKVIPNDKSIVKPFVLNIEDAPIAAFPFLIVPMDQNRTNGMLTPRWGVNLNGSGSIDNIGYYWAPSDYFDFLVAGKIDDFESYVVKAESRYAVKNKLSGRLYADYSLNEKYRAGSRRWSIDFNHNQNLLPDNSLTLTGRGHIVSDKEYYSDHSEDTTRQLRQNLTSNVSLTKKFNQLGGYSSISWNRVQNLNTQTVDQSLPKVRFSLNQRPIIPLLSGTEPEDEMWYNKVRWSYSANANQQYHRVDDPDSSVDLVSRGFAHKIPISAPFEIFDYLTVTPSITLNHSIFDSYSDTTTKDTTIEYETVYSEISLEKSKDIDFILGVDNGTNIIIDTVVENRDTTIRYNPVDTARTVIRQDTTYWHESDFDFEKANNFWWNAGVSLNTRVYGFFPVTVGKLTGIRHTLSPTMTYKFTPEKNLNVVFPRSPGISSTTGTDQRQDMSFGLSNLFEARYMKNDKENRVKLFTLNLTGSYNFEADVQKWADFRLNGSIPTPYVDLSYSGSYRPYTPDSLLVFPEPISHSLRINPKLPRIAGSFWSGDFLTLEDVGSESYLDGIARSNTTGWHVNISPRYNMTLSRSDINSSFKKTQTYNLGTGLQLDFSHRWSIKWNGNYSFTEGDFINQSVSLYADLESWELKFDWYPSGINGGRIYFLVNIKKHRDIQWQKKD